jgi:hypothetical protein
VNPLDLTACIVAAKTELVLVIGWRKIHKFAEVEGGKGVGNVKFKPLFVVGPDEPTPKTPDWMYFIGSPFVGGCDCVGPRFLH